MVLFFFFNYRLTSEVLCVSYWGWGVLRSLVVIKLRKVNELKYPPSHLYRTSVSSIVISSNKDKLVKHGEKQTIVWKTTHSTRSAQSLLLLTYLRVLVSCAYSRQGSLRSFLLSGQASRGWEGVMTRRQRANYATRSCVQHSFEFSKGWRKQMTEFEIYKMLSELHQLNAALKLYRCSVVILSIVVLI